MVLAGSADSGEPSNINFAAMNPVNCWTINSAVENSTTFFLRVMMEISFIPVVINILSPIKILVRQLL